MYTINVTKDTTKDMKKLDSMIRLAAIRAMNQLMSFPNVTELEPMKGRGMGFWRKKFRKDWRVIFFVDESRLIITVFQIGHRRELYRKFDKG